MIQRRPTLQTDHWHFQRTHYGYRRTRPLDEWIQRVWKRSWKHLCAYLVCCVKEHCYDPHLVIEVRYYAQRDMIAHCGTCARCRLHGEWEMTRQEGGGDAAI